MKSTKTLSIIVLVIALVAGLLILTGCGETKPASTTTNTPAPTNTPSNAVSNTNDNTNSNDDKNTTAQVIQVPMTIINNVPDTTIKQLYLSGAGINTWGAELLGGQEMPTGTQLTVMFNIDNNNVNWDIKAVDEEGVAVIFEDLDLSNVNVSGGTITLTLVNDTPIAIAQ